MARQPKTAKPRAKARRPPRGAETDDLEERRAFVRDLVKMRLAAVPRADGTLPPGATHAITGVDDKGEPIVKRLRFSARSR